MIINYLRKKLDEIKFAVAEIEGFIQSFEDNAVYSEKNGEDAEVEMKKLKYGQGSIRRRSRTLKDGSIKYYYEVRYIDAYGNRRAVSANTQKEVLAKLHVANKEKAALLKAKPIKKIEPPKLIATLLSNYLWDYYNSFRKMNLSKSTAQSYETCLTKHLDAELGNTALENLTTMRIMASLSENPNQRQRKILSQLIVAAMKQAFADGLIKHQIWLGIKVKDKKPDVKVILTREMEQELYHYVSDYAIESAIRAYLATGCRPSELFSIREQHIDRVGKLLTIPGTKTKKAHRVIPLLADAATALPISGTTMQSVQRKLKEFSTHAGEQITAYTFRHTFATRCYELGIPLKTMQLWLGHASIQMTGDIYTHASTIAESKSARKLLEKNPI